MKTITLYRAHILLISAIWMVFFFGLSITQFNQFEILNIVGFLFLSLVPGFLTVVLFEIRGLPFWGYLITIIGFSVLELMVSALLGNTLLPLIGIDRPLDKAFLILDLYVLVSALLALVWVRVKDIQITIKPYLFVQTRRDLIMALVPLIFVVLSVLGAIHLNDGGSGIITFIMLGSMGLYIWILASECESFDENVITTAIFFMTAALLFMTSLRGWYITGHDIQREYKVFELAQTNGLWSMANYRDAYNACLSITILPTVFANLLYLPFQYVFKIFFQIFFACTPVLVYLIGRQWTSKKISLLGALYFLAFPTFFTDMPFITRQEIAFVFYGLMLYLVFQKVIGLRLRKILFVCMGIGIILSHYSTTYIVLITLGLAALARPVFRKISSLLREKKIFQDTSVFSEDTSKPSIAFSLVVFLLFLSFLWTSVITQTGNSVSSVVGQTFAAVQQGFGGDNRSIDVTSLVSFSKPNLNSELQSYITTVVDPIRADGSPGEYYPVDTYSQYLIQALNDEVLPLTPLGNFFNNLGLNISKLVAFSGQVLAKIFELFIPLGMLYLFFKNRIANKVSQELYLIAIVCLVFIALNIVLPVLSVEYGIFRAIQQSMFVIAPIMVIGSIFLGELLIRGISFIKIRNTILNFKVVAREVIAPLFVIIFLFYSTGLIPQLFGGNTPLLHLNNSGVYYDDFLTQPQEVAGIEWLVKYSQNNPDFVKNLQFEVQSDRFSSSKFTNVTDLASANDILPGLVRQNAYIFLSVANVAKQRAAEVVNGDRISYSYPLQFLDKNKDLIYSNGGSEIYR